MAAGVVGWEDGKMGWWEDGKMGWWEDGKMSEWEDEKMGEWENGEEGGRWKMMGNKVPFKAGREYSK